MGAFTTGLRTAVFPLMLGAAFAAPAFADVVTDWNARAEALAVEKRLLPPPNARGMAILHVAMFEAVNAIDRKYSPYKLNLAADRSTSKEAAAAFLVQAQEFVSARWHRYEQLAHTQS